MSQSNPAQPQRLPDPLDARWRLAVGLGDPDRERALLPALRALGDFVVVERCLAADQLLACLQGRRADAAILAFDLHRLSQGVIADLRQTRVPLVTLAPDPNQERWRSLPGVVLPLDADAAMLERALTAALRGERPPPAEQDEPLTLSPTQEARSQAPPALSLIALAGGYGSPGRTTLALNLAAALGAVAPTVLVDADLNNPSLAIHLDADPTRNLSMLAHAEPDTPRAWRHALDGETQPLAARSPHAVVLCGLPKPELRSQLTLPFFERLLEHLRLRYRYVILDVGAEVHGSESALHRAALQLADHTLVIVAADLVGLRQGQRALTYLTDTLGLPHERVAIILNRHDRHRHHSRPEIEWALDRPVAGVIPYDHAAVQRALDRQQPLLLAGKSRAGRAILDLAERLHAGQVVLPPEAPSKRRFPWRLNIKKSKTGQTTPVEGDLHGHVPIPDEPLAEGQLRSNGRARPPRRGPRGR
ncbi:MAG: cellulose synthase operon protein YhjQ/BcsQ [Anaerolineae bacterium]